MMNLKTKEYSYQPMNATEYFLHEIARNTETIAELLKQQKTPTVELPKKVVEKAVPVVKVEPEVQSKPKHTNRKRTAVKE